MTKGVTMSPAIACPKFGEPAAIERREVSPTGEEQRIGEMLSYRRPHDSPGEAEFLARYILPLNPEVIRDDESIHAFIVRIGRTDGARLKRAFCAHTDSVHNRTIMDTRQTVGFDGVRREFFVNAAGQRDCLGADDAAGCYVLLRMIEANVPGMYVFFRGEERGGIGSSYVTEKRADLFDGVEYAVQFDRRGTKSIITEMMCGMTCSNEFGIALGEALGMGHEVDPTGSFTDTANLSEIVPECTNISVGYDNEHSPRETLDADYLLELVDACIDTFSDSGLELPITRAPADYGQQVDAWDNYTTMYGASARSTVPMISAYDLPTMTRGELRAAVARMHDDDIVELLYDVGEELAAAFYAADDEFEETVEGLK